MFWITGTCSFIVRYVYDSIYLEFNLFGISLEYTNV